MNVKIGELVEYVEGLNNASHRRANRMHGTINDLLAIKKELEEELDGRDQLIHRLEEKVAVAEENAASCLKSFKEMEVQVDQSIQSAVTAFKIDIRNRLRKEYGYSDEGLKNIGVL